jgi:virulence factor
MANTSSLLKGVKYYKLCSVNKNGLNDSVREKVMAKLVAIIGLGSIAQKAYLPVLSAWEGIELLLCSRNPDSVAKIQEQYRIRHGSTRLEELVEWHPTAAIVLTPSKSHREIVEQLLLADIDVYVEKPLTPSLNETRGLAELADQKGKVLMVGFNRRYAPLHQQARLLWGDRPIQTALFQKNRSSAYHPDLYQNYIDDTIHIIDLLRYFCGDGTAVHTSYQLEHSKLVGAVSTVTYPHGGYGMVLTSLKAGHWYENYALHGENTSMYVDAFNRLVLVTENEQKVWNESYASAWKTTLKARGFVDEIAHFFDCIQTRAVPQTSAWESYKTQKLLEDMVIVGKV